MAVIFIALIIINWIIYHKIFDVVYFRLGAGLFKEFAICFFLAGIEMAILSALASYIIPIIIVLVVVIGVPIGIKNFLGDIKKHKKSQEDSSAKKDEETKTTEETGQ